MSILKGDKIMTGPQVKSTNRFLADVQPGGLHLPKYKKNILYKDFNKDSKIYEKEVFSVDIKRTSVFNGKPAVYTQTWIDQDGDGLSDWFIKEYRDIKTNDILGTEKFKAENDVNASLDCMPCEMSKLVEESDNDWYKNPEQY